MKYLYIFVLLLVACSDVNFDKCTPFEVTISDALPIQFWLNDCDTYNQKEVCGVHRKCFCQPWNCGDDISIQFVDSDISDFILRVYNEEQEVEEEIEFNYYQQSPAYPSNLFQPFPLVNWTTQTGSGTSWVTGIPFPNVSLGTGIVSSKKLFSDFSAPAGTFSFHWHFANSGPAINATIQFWKNGVDIGSASGIPISGFTASVQGDETVTLSDVADQVSIIVFKTTPGSAATIFEFNANLSTDIEPVAGSPVIYSMNYAPLCNQRIRLEIVEVASSPETVIAKSDCIDVRTSHDCATLLEYTNNRNYAGLVYENVSPVTTFKILVPAIFFHERFPEEDNVIEVSDAIIHTSGQVKAQRLFETDYLPYYMHRKLKLILKHQTVLIDNQYWTKEESYDVQDGERRWPVKKGKCFLTEKNYVQRAVL